MLVLTRKCNQNIIIGEAPNDITVTVLDINEYNVRLGISAPKSISVHREEVHKKLIRQKKHKKSAS